jgi:hypothetical protein
VTESEQNDRYLRANRANWDARAPVHLAHTFDFDRTDEQVACIGNYFGDVGPEEVELATSYTGDALPAAARINFQWTHPVGAILSAFHDSGLGIERFEELDWLDWQALPHMVRDPEGRWRFPGGRPRLPLQFAVVAVRPEA